uniref:Uncharacterized protein n=1 Tax=Oryza sativa subsp. japonica TaxID=39947 RepID=Q6H615_ORYSJ|nr:hypothetical protein [Oryza sativa Japonica Group]
MWSTIYHKHGGKKTDTYQETATTIYMHPASPVVVLRSILSIINPNQSWKRKITISNKKQPNQPTNRPVSSKPYRSYAYDDTQIRTYASIDRGGARCAVCLNNHHSMIFGRTATHECTMA